MRLLLVIAKKSKPLLLRAEKYTYRTIHRLHTLVRPYALRLFRVLRAASRRIHHAVRPYARTAWKHVVHTYRTTHHHVARRPHEHLKSRWRWYGRWHAFQFHGHVHGAVFVIEVLLVSSLFVTMYRTVSAFTDITDTWNFSVADDFTADAGIELSGTSARLKAQNYTDDANTAALFHFDELNGSVANDSSANNNDGTVANATFVAGSLNNALDFNGTTASVSAPDSASLSLSQQNTVEAWSQLDSSLAPGNTAQHQVIADKGEYQLYYDNETGKVTYELARSTATNWSVAGGNEVNSGWDVNGERAVNVLSEMDGDVYAAVGIDLGDAEIWRWDGTDWTLVGGGPDSVNGSWDNQTYEGIHSLSNDGTNIYAGMGTTAGDADVWRFNGTTWTKIGGDGVNSSWAGAAFEVVYALEFFDGNLYAGLGNSANDAEVWRWGGSSWTKIGGDSLNSGWTTNYELVYSLANDGTNLYAGLGSTAGDAEVWRWNGTAWTKIGGDSINSGWDATIEIVRSLLFAGGVLYAGLGDTVNDADLYSWNGTAWTKIGGDGVNSSWNTNYEYVKSLAHDGTSLYAGLGASDGDGEVWRYTSGAWTKIGGDAVNGSWATAIADATMSLTFVGSTLYAGLMDAAGTGYVYTWNGTAWTVNGGNYVNKSWGYYGLGAVQVMQQVGDYMYAGLGNAAGTAVVFRFNGTTWELVGGQGVNGSWAVNAYEQVMSMASYGGNLYVGLGTTANDAEVWRFNGTTWTQVGGDSLNSGWTTNYEEVSALAVYGGFLYAGIGNSANDAEVWRYNGTAWTKIGGDNLNSGWNTNFERVASMAIFEGQLLVGLGASATDAEVWRWNGAAWTKIGGDSLNSGWDNVSFEQVETMIPYAGKLYAGLGNSADDAEVWEWNGTAWTKIGGDDVNSSWTAGTYERVKTMSVYNGDLYAGLGASAGDGEVWRYNGTSWSLAGGDSLNSSWGAAIEEVEAFSVYKGKFYAGLGQTVNADALVYSLGDNGFLQSTTTSFNTDWRHIAATYDGSTMRLYINGTLESSLATVLTMPDGTHPLLIGRGYGGREAGKSPAAIDGRIDELRISSLARSSFTTTPYSASPQAISLSEAVRKSGIWHWDSFTGNETLNGGQVTYRLSDDEGTTWKYWNGSGWVLSASTSQSNAQADISTNIETFPVTFDGIRWQAILDGDGTQRVTLNSVAIDSTGDVDAPVASGVDITALKATAGSALAVNGWTNGGSPVFNWTAADDTESGIKGYCAYLGQDNTADPISTKGLLGTSPVDPGSQCQFVVSGTQLDLATPGLLGTALTTSSSAYYLTLKPIDQAGNVSNDDAQFHFRFDNTLPTNPSFITAPSGFVNNKAVTLSWPTVGGSAPSDANAGLAGLQYRISNTGTWYGDSHSGTGDANDLLANDGSYLTQDPPDFDDLEEGINTVYFRTWDAAGNVTTNYVTAAVKINTAGAPTEPQNIQATPSVNTVNSFAFSWSVPATFVGEANSLTYCYTFNVVPSSSNCTFTGPGVTSLGAGAYATQPGSNTIYVVAKDESGSINYDSYGQTGFTANTPSPGIPLNLDIVDVSIKSTSKWRLALTWDEPTYEGAGIASFKVYRSTDNVTYNVVGSSSSTTYIDAGITQQRYYYKVVACDSTNNCGALSSEVSEIPTGKFTSAALLVAEPTVSDITTKKATIRWSTDRASDSKIAIGTTSGQYSSSEIASSEQVSAHQIDLDNLSAGTTYYVVAKWTDEDGNIGTSQEYSFTTAPPPSLKEVTTLKAGLTNATVQFTSKNATRVSLLYGKSEGFGGLKTINTSTSESTYTIELTGLDDGVKYFYQLVSFDSEGGSYPGSVVSFTTLARPRIANLTFQPIPGEPTSTQKVSWTTNVASTSTVTYGKVGTAGSDTVDSTMTTNHEIIIRDLEDDSQYFLFAQSRDEGGNLATSDRQIFKTALDTRPPKIDEISIEASIRGTGAEARGQVVVSWRTDELSTSQVAYAEGSDVVVFNNKTAEDSAMSFEHIVIVSDLPTSKVYSIQPVSRDKSGNAGTGEVQSAIIGRASDSVLAIVLATLKNVFGF